jgi:hypothetical protein
MTATRKTKDWAIGIPYIENTTPQSGAGRGKAPHLDRYPLILKHDLEKWSRDFVSPHAQLTCSTWHDFGFDSGEGIYWSQKGFEGICNVGAWLSTLRRVRHLDARCLILGLVLGLVLGLALHFSSGSLH